MDIGTDILKVDSTGQTRARVPLENLAGGIYPPFPGSRHYRRQQPWQAGAGQFDACQSKKDRGDFPRQPDGAAQRADTTDCRFPGVGV